MFTQAVVGRYNVAEALNEGPTNDGTELWRIFWVTVLPSGDVLIVWERQ